MKELKLEADLQKFDYYEINGMKLSDPQQACIFLCNDILGVKANFNKASELLEAKFISSKKPIIVLIDELDLLISTNQKVIYNFLDWPNRPNSSLIVIAIANTMDLPERVFLNRVSSRMGMFYLNIRII